jgi:hypothetical protein
MNDKKTRAFLAAIVAVTFFAVVSAVHAQSFVIEGNGSGSDNSVQSGSSNTTNTHQSNQGSFQNNIDVNADTGNNHADDNTGSVKIITGDATTQTTIINEGNINKANVPGCCQNQATPAPTKKPGSTPTPPPTGGGSGPTPTPQPSGGSGSPPGNNGDGGSSGGGTGGGQVLGLSATAGNEPEQYIFYAFGSLCLGIATFVLTGRKSPVV